MKNPAILFSIILFIKSELDQWDDYAQNSDLVKKHDIDIGEEEAGLIPNTKYYEKILWEGLAEKYYGESWNWTGRS